MKYHFPLATLAGILTWLLVSGITLMLLLRLPAPQPLLPAGLLREAWRRINDKGYQLGNLDVTIIAQAPKMAPHIDAMRRCIADDLDADMSQINVKATTTEKLGFVGRKEGIAAEAVVLLVGV